MNVAGLNNVLLASASVFMHAVAFVAYMPLLATKMFGEAKILSFLCVRYCSLRFDAIVFS